MALGLAPREQLVRSAAAGPGNVLVLFGASTGRDGIGGASVLASAELRRGRRGQAPDRAGRRSVRGEEAARVLARAAGARAARLAAGPRRGGADVARRRRWPPRARSGSTSTSAQGAPARGRHGAVRDDGLASPRSGCCAWSSRRNVDAVLALCEKWEVERRGDRRGHRHRPRARARGRRARGRHAGARARRRLPAVRPRAREARREPIYPPPRLGALAADGDAARDAARAARQPEHRLAPAAVRAVRRDRAVAHGAPPRAGRRGGARASGDSGDRSGTRRALASASTATAVASPPTPTAARSRAVLECAANLACVGARAAGHDEQPQLRQPGEAAHRVAADRGGARPGRGVPGAARRRSSAATSRSTTRARPGPIYPTPVIGMVGLLPDARRAGRLGFARAGDEIALVGPFAPVAGRERAGQAARARRCPTACRRSSSQAVREAQAAVREAVRAGALCSAHDIAEGGVAVALAECCLAGGLGASVELASDERRAVRRGPGRVPRQRERRGAAGAGGAHERARPGHGRRRVAGGRGRPGARSRPPVRGARSTCGVLRMSPRPGC